MRLLLDTHTFIWFIRDDPKLSRSASLLIEDAANTVYVSIVSIWEMAIKASLGKLDAPPHFAQVITRQLHENDFLLLDIRIEHTEQIVRLPFHHRDPFDRLLIAQSLSENIPLIGKDTSFDAYGITRFWD